MRSPARSPTYWLTTIGSSARTYDANGATTGIAGGGDTFGYGYDGRHRMTVVQRNGSTVGTYSYNDLGQRVAKSASAPQSANERFTYDEAWQLLGEYGTTNKDYIWLDDLPVAVVDTNGTAAAVSYIHADGTNTPRAVANSTGMTIWQWSYKGNPFGEQSPTSSNGYVFSLRLPGQYADSESRLAYNANRYLEAARGGYTQADPTGLNGGLNLYAYGGNNPLLYIDPLGLKYAETWAAGGAVVGGTVTAGASVVVDAFTGGVNILATPAEIAGGASLGAGIGYIVGSGLDWATGSSTSPVVGPISRPDAMEMAKGGSQNIENEYSREARRQPDPCDWLDEQYAAARSAGDFVAAQKIIKAQKALGCRNIQKRCGR